MKLLLLNPVGLSQHFPYSAVVVLGICSTHDDILFVPPQLHWSLRISFLVCVFLLCTYVDSAYRFFSASYIPSVDLIARSFNSIDRSFTDSVGLPQSVRGRILIQSGGTTSKHHHQSENRCKSASGFHVL